VRCDDGYISSLRPGVVDGDILLNVKLENMLLSMFCCTGILSNMLAWSLVSVYTE